jgi:Trk K+ transport system NAD-binding subunit
LSESILTALNVKDLGVKKIFAKAQSENHGRILEKLGVNEVFFPEKDLAVSVARRIHNPNMIDHIPFVEGYTIVEMAPPRSFIGKRLKEANIINKFGVQPRWVKSRSASSDIQMARMDEDRSPEQGRTDIPAPHVVPVTEVSQYKACSITDPDCEACQ